MYVNYEPPQAAVSGKRRQPVPSGLAAGDEVPSAVDGAVRLRRQEPSTLENHGHLDAVGEAHAIVGGRQDVHSQRRPLVAPRAMLSGVRIATDFVMIGLGVQLAELIHGGWRAQQSVRGGLSPCCSSRFKRSLGPTEQTHLQRRRQVTPDLLPVGFW
jgi:hypothetical protein